MPTFTIPIKAISEEGFHNYACEYRVAKNIMVAEQLTPAYCEVLIALFGPASVAVEFIICDVVVVVWQFPAAMADPGLPRCPLQDAEVKAV